MMSLKVRIVILAVIFVALVAIINLIRKRSLELKYALTLLFLGGALFVVVMIPGVIQKMSLLLGIYSPMNMVFFLGFLFSLIVIFSLTMALSRNSIRVRKMAQKIALNEYRSNHAVEK